MINESTMRIRHSATKTLEGTKVVTTRPEDYVSWLDTSGTMHTKRADSSLLRESLHEALPARKPNHYFQQRNYLGLYWFSQTSTHVRHESLFEMTALRWLDFRANIVEIAAQPCRIQFRNGKIHVPDYFAVHSDGRQVLYDVRPRFLIDEKAQAQFAETERVCKSIGWEYELFTEIPAITKLNLEWLAGYRHPRNDPSTMISRLVRAALAPERSLGELIDLVCSGQPARYLHNIYHLMWTRRLAFDIAQPLNHYTKIWSNSDAWN